MVEQNQNQKCDCLPGTVIAGKFEVVRQIGDNSYQVKDSSSSKLLVLKVVTTAAQAGQLQEICKGQASLVHANLGVYIDFGDDPKLGHYLLREFISGTTLGDRINQKGVLNQIEFLDVFQQACAGLLYCHKKSLFHGNLKPNNFVITDDYVLKLVDFLPGVVASTDGAAANAGALEDLLYLSPEQLTAGEANAVSDIYSIGATMYYALSAAPPLDARNIAELIQKKQNNDPLPFISLIPARKVDSQIEQVIFRCLDKIQGQRYQSVESLKADLKRIEEGDEIKPIGASSPKPKALIIGIVAFVFLAAAASYFLAVKSPNRKVTGKTTQVNSNLDKLSKEEDQADSLYKNGELAEAAEAFNRLEPVFSSQFGQESKEHVRILHKLARCQLANKEIDLARDSYNYLAEILSKRPDLAPKHFQPQFEIFTLGKKQFKNSEYQLAEDTFTLAFRIEKQLGDDRSPMGHHILIWEGKAEAANGNFKDSSRSLKRAVEAFKERYDDPDNLAFALHEYGNMLFLRAQTEESKEKQKSLEDAASKLKRALSIRQRRNDEAAAETKELFQKVLAAQKQ